ncbi:MAG: STAS domain-containing protein [Desulfobacteraceae bacterium]|nr:STAS domain-containing protein [Desulfobacteraceae bacterium]
MQIKEEKQNEVHIFKLEGRLDSNTSPTFEEKVAGAIAKGAIQMIIDLENLEYLSSAGLRVILKTTKDLKRLEGKLVLCSMADYVREVFEISGFDSFLPITASRDDALKKF